jgi:hypothetical protein
MQRKYWTFDHDFSCNRMQREIRNKYTTGRGHLKIREYFKMGIRKTGFEDVHWITGLK